MKRKLKTQFRKLEMSARSLVKNFNQGIHHGLFPSSAGDIDSVREYVPGDRRLDCRSSLKTGKVMSRTFIPERQMTVFLVLDASCSQSYGENLTKLEAGILVSLYFNFLAGEANDKIGLISFDQSVRILCEPTINENYIPSLLFDNLTSPLQQEIPKGTNPTLALEKTLALELSDTLFVFISDFYFPLEDKFLTLLKSLAAGNNNAVIAAVLINKQEWFWPRQKFLGEVLDSEKNQRLTVSFGNARLIGHQERSFDQWQEQLLEKLKQSHCRPALIDVNDKRKMLLPLVRLLLAAG